MGEVRDVIMLEVPKNAVNTAVCDKLCIRYGVIVYGPFDVPEGYQLGSMAVYIYFEDDHAVKPVLLHLPHWSGKDGESKLKCAIAPHRLEEGEEKYKFGFTEDGDFESTEGSCVITIDGHCSLFALIIKALQHKSSLRYYASRVEEVGDCGTTLDVVITHASQVWLEVCPYSICVHVCMCICIMFMWPCMCLQMYMFACMHVLYMCDSVHGVVVCT